MKTGELAIAMQQFNKEIVSLDGDALIDKWIAFKGSPESKVPDLGLAKSLAMESALIAKFGIDYRKAVEARKAKSSDA